LRALGGNEGDAELIQCAAELGGLTFSGEFFFDRPVVVVANEDAAAIPVEGDWNERRQTLRREPARTQSFKQPAPGQHVRSTVAGVPGSGFCY